MRYATFVTVVWMLVLVATAESCPAAGPDLFAQDAAGTPDRAAALGECGRISAWRAWTGD